MDYEKSHPGGPAAETPEGAAAERAPAAPAAFIESAFCGSLRSKKFFMLDGLANEASQYLDASNHCWCRETHLVFGPDGGRARPERCVPGRSCYSSALGGD
jgi:hypothetical protein